MFHYNASFYGDELSAHRQTPNLEDHPLSAVRDFLVNIFAATPHTGGSSSVRNVRTRHAVVTGPTFHRNSSYTRHTIHINLSYIAKVYVRISDKLEMAEDSGNFRGETADCFTWRWCSKLNN